MFEGEPYDWRDLIDWTDHASMDGPLAGEIAGLPPGIRFSHILQASLVNSIRAIGLTREDCQNLPDGYFLDLTHLNETRDPGNVIKLQHQPDRLPVEEMKRKIGWD